MKGFEVVARFTDHFRRYTGSAAARCVFAIHGSPTLYRIATIKADGKRTVITLVKAAP